MTGIATASTTPRIVISASYGNDSIALIQWAREAGIVGALVVYVDTGWSSPDWPDRVERAETWVRSIGYRPVRITPPMQFEELMRHKRGFPSQRYQWCSGLLKGLPFLTWIDDADPECQAVVMIGKRREESRERAETPEFVEASEYHGGRRLWHPLYMHDTVERDALLRRAGWEILPHRSRECSPCINADKGDLRDLSEWEIQRLEQLEDETGQVMFRAAKKGGARGIRRVIAWAYSERGKYDDNQGVLFTRCSSGYCGS